MDEKRIEQVLEIEKQAQGVREAATKEAEQIPIRANEEAQALIQKTRLEAEEEARQIVAHAHAKEETERILSQAEEDARRTEALATTNFDRAVAYVLNRAIGKE